ncbi:hypothetical protein R1flu_000237 [Riccia fluitans]|uniref:Uncharacterized protein n=1 Tax=Riccia fluitans TaxID=41844 RepID=A0ABD1Y2U9_9MARC
MELVEATVPETAFRNTMIFFFKKRKGKLLLKEEYKPSHRDHLNGEHRMRSWLKDHETDDLQRQILQDNYRSNPSMKAKLMEFIMKRIQELPPITFRNVTDSTSSDQMPWIPQTVYNYIISQRQDKKKNLKKGSFLPPRTRSSQHKHVHTTQDEKSHELDDAIRSYEHC